jgi:hypothetical protein
MHFIDPSADAPMLAELKEMGILTPAMIERIDLKLNRPETGTLNELLLAGAEIVAERDWLSWQIRRHGCHRFGRVAWREEAAEWAQANPPSDGNLPYRRGLNGNPLVALLRPDLWEATAARFGRAQPHRAAATLGEIRELARAWARSNAGFAFTSNPSPALDVPCRPSPFSIESRRVP